MLSIGTSPDSLKLKAAGLLGQLRSAQPRVHCITNSVAQTLTANVLLALGVEPSMTIAPDEIASFVQSSDAILINLGTLDDDRRRAAIIAAETARGLGRPFVLDPVFAHRSSSRKALAERILALEPTVMRGNAEELSGLVRAGDKTACVQTGAQDIVTFSGCAATIENGDQLMARTTGMGCALGAVMAAMLAVEDDRFDATIAALLIFGVAGQIAAKDAKGPGSFVPLFLDALHVLQPSDIVEIGHLA